MGRAARLKTQRQQDARAQAWAAGVPSVVTMSEQAFLAVQQAMAARVRLEQLCEGMKREARRELATAMQAAGLDPARNYRLDRDRLVAEIVE